MTTYIYVRYGNTDTASGSPPSSADFAGSRWLQRVPKRVIFQSDCSIFTLLTRPEVTVLCYLLALFRRKRTPPVVTVFFCRRVFSLSSHSHSPVTSASYLRANSTIAIRQVIEGIQKNNPESEGEKKEGNTRNARDALVERSPGAPSAASPLASVSDRLSLLYYSERESD